MHPTALTVTRYVSTCHLLCIGNMDGEWCLKGPGAEPKPLWKYLWGQGTARVCVCVCVCVCVYSVLVTTSSMKWGTWTSLISTFLRPNSLAIGGDAGEGQYSQVLYPCSKISRLSIYSSFLSSLFLFTVCNVFFSLTHNLCAPTNRRVGFNVPGDKHR